MFGIGSTELLVIFLVALVVLGPKSLAGLTKSLGRAMGEFRRVSTEFQRTLNAEVEQEAEADRQRQAQTAASRSAAPESPSPQAAPVQEQAAAPQPVTPPADSPLAQALAKAKAEAGDEVTPPKSVDLKKGGSA